LHPPIIATKMSSAKQVVGIVSVSGWEMCTYAYSHVICLALICAPFSLYVLCFAAKRYMLQFIVASLTK
jgi:hypothetical protein